MKNITQFINEEWRSSRYTIDPEDINGELTVCCIGDGNPGIIIGRPFTNERDEQYIVAQELAKRFKLPISVDFVTAVTDFNTFINTDEVEYWVLVYYQTDGTTQVMPYGDFADFGVYAINKI
jgi:hypothetical protein